jgi:hypothetical protein
LQRQSRLLGRGDAAHRAMLAGPERAAFTDRLVEQALRQRRRHQDADRVRAGGFAEDDDIVGVAAERGDIVANPAQGGYPIENAVHAGGMFLASAGELWMLQKAEHAEPIVQRDDHNTRLGETTAVDDIG